MARVDRGRGPPGIGDRGDQPVDRLHRQRPRDLEDEIPGEVEIIRSGGVDGDGRDGLAKRKRHRADGYRDIAPVDPIVRFSQFLTLVGLTALIVGGVGVANAVRAYLDSKRGVIATFKCLGASGGFVFSVYLIQIMIITTIGIAFGLVLGALMPILASIALAEVLPVSSELALYPGALAFAAVFGYLTALAFALLPPRVADVPERHPANDVRAPGEPGRDRAAGVPRVRRDRR